jgi:hypothetical protein
MYKRIETVARQWGFDLDSAAYFLQILGSFGKWGAKSRRAPLCQAPENTCPMPPKASPIPKICPNRRSFLAAATFPNGRARIVGTAPIGIAKESGSCTIWEIWSRGVRAMSI